MRGRRLLLTNAAVMVATVVIGWTLSAGRDEPIGPDLGPAVQVGLSFTTVTPNRPTPAGGFITTTPPPAPTSAVTPAPTPATTTTSTGTRVTPRALVAPSSGAQTVPRQSPMPAGDDDDDDDDGQDDDDDD